MKVIRNTIFSSPLLVNDDLDDPQTLPNPVPLFCVRINKVSTIDTTIWATIRKLLIVKNYLIIQCIEEIITESINEKKIYAKNP